MLDQLSNDDLQEIKAAVSAAEKVIAEFGPAMEKLRRRLDTELLRRSTGAPS